MLRAHLLADEDELVGVGYIIDLPKSTVRPSMLIAPTIGTRCPRTSAQPLLACTRGQPSP